MARFDLSDEEWAIISPLLPEQGRGAKRGDDRKVLNGIFYILRTGAPWRDLPERYGPRTTVYNRDLRPNSPPAFRRIRRLVFGPKRPFYSMPFSWRTRWA